MSNHAAITVNRSREEVERLWNSEVNGTVTFADAPGDRGTEIHVDLECGTPRQARRVVSKLVGSEPLAKVKDELRRFKQRVETGEIPRSDGVAGGRAGRAQAQAAPRPAAGRRRAREGGCAMRANVWSGRNTVQVENVPDPKILNDARRDREDHVDGDLRLGPAPLRRLHPDDGEGRHPRPRVHGRGRRGRPRRRRTSRSATASSCRSRSRAATAGACQHELYSLLRELEPERRARREDVRPRDRRHLRLLAPAPAATPAARPSTRACRSPTSGRSRSPDDLHRRAGAVPVGHLPDRLHGRRVLRDHAAAR